MGSQRTRVRTRQGPAQASRGTGAVTRTPGGDEAVRHTFGRVVSDAALAHLAGAPPGSHVMVRELSGSGGVQLQVFGPSYRQHLTVARHLAGDIELNFYTMHVESQAQRQGLAAAVFPRMVAGARRLGVDRITADLSRHEEQGIFGYRVWGRFGFDAPLRASDVADLPRPLGRATTLLDLMQTRAGQQWWAEHGHSIDATFDLRPGSRSMRQLQNYLDERRGRDYFNFHGEFVHKGLTNYDAMQRFKAGDHAAYDAWYAAHKAYPQTVEAMAARRGASASLRLDHTHAGRFATISPSTSTPGSWRYTRWDDRGPSGHTEAASRARAIELALEDGYTTLRQITK